MRLTCSISIVALLVVILGDCNLVAGKQLPLGPLDGTQSSGTNHGALLDDEFATWLQETGKSWGMKGVVVVVTRKNKQGEGWTTETKGYGVADRWGTPMDEETLFTIGSNSKLFTAAAIGMLTLDKNNSLGWDSKIKNILPHSIWALEDKIAEEHANLVDILSHRIGLPPHDLGYSRGDTLENSLAKLRYLRPSAEFREMFQYNNQMYAVASHIISHLSGIPFAKYITRNIITPLGLSSTTYNVTQAEQSGKLAEGFVNAGKDEERGEGRRKVRNLPIPYWNQEGGRDLFAGPGGVISNARDLAIWLQALLLSGRSPANGEVVIPASVVEKAAQGVTVRVPAASFPELSAIVYGMGQKRFAYQGHEIIEHNGGLGGQYSVVTRCPEKEIGIAVLANWDDGYWFTEVVKWRILEQALGLKEVDWNQRYHKQADHLSAATAGQKPVFSSGSQPPRSFHHGLGGTYSNAAYGTLSLCTYRPSQDTQPSSKACGDLNSVARTSLHRFINDSIPTLLATWPKIWSTHLILQHTSGDNFAAYPVHEYPAPFPDSKSKGDDNEPFAVTFAGISWNVQFITQKGTGGAPDVVQGMAWTGVWNCGRKGVPLAKGEGREGAEVWFDRLD